MVRARTSRCCRGPLDSVGHLPRRRTSHRSLHGRSEVRASTGHRRESWLRATIDGAPGSEIAYGLILINQSTTTDARDVTVNANFLDSLGQSVTTWTSTVSVIPAATRFYLAGKAFSTNTLSATSMQVTSTTDTNTPKSVALPLVTNVAILPNGFGTTDINGQLTNPYPKPLPQVATVNAVVLDGTGTIIGGGYQQTRTRVQPGTSFDFHLTYFDLFPTPAGTSTLVSIDPCGGIAVDCAVLAP